MRINPSWIFAAVFPLLFLGRAANASGLTNAPAWLLPRNITAMAAHNGRVASYGAGADWGASWGLAAEYRRVDGRLRLDAQRYPASADIAGIGLFAATPGRLSFRVDAGAGVVFVSGPDIDAGQGAVVTARVSMLLRLAGPLQLILFGGHIWGPGIDVDVNGQPCRMAGGNAIDAGLGLRLRWGNL